MRETKKQVYARFGIQYKNGKILSPFGEWVSEILKKGNVKTGVKVYTFSTLPTNRTYHTKYGDIKGTCPCKCADCYATLGCYNFPTVINSLALNTVLVRRYLEFVECALMAQLETLKSVDEIRIFASGDFYISDDMKVNAEYVAMWKRIIKSFPQKFFWTYTKVREFENAFDELENANIVKSVINGIGFNYGEVEYILNAYYKLKKANKDVYICKCGFDENQHCHNCHSCSKHDFVLFIIHSNGYEPTTSARYAELYNIVMNQENENYKKVA